MKKRILFILLAVILAVSLSLIACNGEQEEEEEEEEEEPEVFSLTFGTIHPAEAPMNSVINAAWIDWLEEESEGRIEIVPLSGGAAGDPPELYDNCRTGVIDIACHMIGFNPARWPLTEVLFLPLIFEYPGSRAAALTAMALYDKYPEIQAEHSEVKVLGFHANGPAQIHTVDEPVETMEDLVGLTIDTEGLWAVKALTALGATVESVGAYDRYDALSKGTIDGNVLEWEGQFVWNLFDLTNYSVEVGLYSFIFIHVMNLDTWNSLPADLQELFVGDNAELYFTLHGYNFDKDDIMFRDNLDGIYKDRGNPGIYVLPEEEKDRWVEAIMPLREEWLESAAAEVGMETAEAILEDCIAFAEEYKGYPDEECPECATILAEWGAAGY